LVIKIVTASLIIALLITALGACNAAGPLSSGDAAAQADDRVITLNMNLFTPPTHTRWVQITEPWIKEIEKRTDGKVNIVPYHAEEISRMEQNYESLISGIADIGESGFNPGNFPFTEQMANWSSSSRITKNPSAILWQLYKEFPEIQNEFKEVKLLFLHSSLPVRIGTVREAINSLEDIRGLKMGIQGHGLQAHKVESLGASAGMIQASDAYTALDKRVVDGFTADYTLLVARRWGEVMRYLTNINISSSFFYMAMNLDRFNSLPADVRQVFEEMSGDYAVDLYGQSWWDMEIGNKFVFENEMKGMTTSFSLADYATADRAFKAEVEEQIADLESKGYPATKIYMRYLELERQHTVDWP
jgi:TRAP-type C4-dicarboxylate transport system substrate-binding protein